MSARELHDVVVPLLVFLIITCAAFVFGIRLFRATTKEQLAHRAFLFLGVFAAFLFVLFVFYRAWLNQSPIKGYPGGH